MGKCKYVLGILLMMCCLFSAKCKLNVQAAGESFDDPLVLTVGVENAMAEGATYYRMEITEPGKYILEGNMASYSYFAYDAQMNEISSKSFFATSSLTCSGDILILETPGTYYLYLGTSTAGTISVRKADIPKIVMGSTASDTVQANRVSFFEFTPTESGRYSFYFTSPGYTSVERVGGLSVNNWKWETTYYDMLFANTTYYFLLCNEEAATVTVTPNLEAGVVEMSVSAPVRTTYYRCFDYWGFDSACKLFLKLSDGSEIETNNIDVDNQGKYGLSGKTYTKDGTEVWFGHDAPVGEYYTILYAGDKVSEPINFVVKEIQDCELVMKNGTILSGLAGDKERYRNQDGAHVVKLIAEESSWYVLRACENSYIDVYDSRLNRVSERAEARPFNVETPGVYYAFVGAQEKFNTEFLKIDKLSELKIADGCRQVYYRSAGENYFNKIVEGICFTGITENGTELSFSYRNENWINYGMWYELKYSGGMLPPSSELPIGNYVLKVTDWSGNYTCEIPFVINETGQASEKEEPKYNGIVFQNGEYYYYVNGVVDTSYNGLAFYNNEWWYVSQGKIDFAKNGLICYEGTWYEVVDGKGQPTTAPAPVQGCWQEESDTTYWYEDGEKQGLEGRGKEIYDPESDAWYWLDSEQDGAVAKNKDVYQESLAGTWGDVVGEDGQTYGKWVRYDENGHMVKGWQTTENGTYYFDLTYGTMAKGFATIDGKEYFFDETTGVLQYELGEVPERGWKTIDGLDYWYENYIRQGYKLDDNYRGKEIYDEATDAWYWLDNVQNGAKAVNKDVYQESQADDAGNIGKWVRYDAEGHMVKGWNTNENGTYYFDMTYGTMLKGEQQIDGVIYYFDEMTGELKK